MEFHLLFLFIVELLSFLSFPALRSVVFKIMFNDFKTCNAVTNYDSCVRFKILFFLLSLLLCTRERTTFE